MAEQVQKAKPQHPEKEDIEEPLESESHQSDEIKAETDALLDEIDGLLEENAADFVRDYVQKGGE